MTGLASPAEFAERVVICSSGVLRGNETLEIIRICHVQPFCLRSSGRYPIRATVTRRLLICGLLAGPVFVAVLAVQLVTRDGFDPGRHPISVLSLGEHGWIQIVNFVLTGALSLAFAVGVRRVLYPGVAGTWGPILIGCYGLGLIIAGIFPGDPGLGFPPGTPDTIQDPSWHGLVHDVGPPVAFVALIAVCFVFARRFNMVGARGWSLYCLTTGIAALVCSVPGPAATVRVLAAVVLTSALTTALAARLLGELSQQ